MLITISNSSVVSIHSFDSEIYIDTNFIVFWESIVLLHGYCKYETMDYPLLKLRFFQLYLKWNVCRHLQSSDRTGEKSAVPVLPGHVLLLLMSGSQSPTTMKVNMFTVIQTQLWLGEETTNSFLSQTMGFFSLSDLWTWHPPIQSLRTPSKH